MNYERIYREFIADRRVREGALEGYTETHHIIPRCMGGSDCAINLIKLTPEDHYFAHLLLAYAYGGKNWCAVHAMCYLVNRHSKNKRSKLKVRAQFGHVKRSLALYFGEIFSGPTSKLADKREFELRHFDGRNAVGNRFALSGITGVSRQQISAVLNGQKKSAHGWYSPSHNPDALTASDLISLNVRSKRIVRLFHHDGRQWEGTPWQFRKDFGLALTFQHPEGAVGGWYRTKTQAEAHGALRKKALVRALEGRGNIRGISNPNADKKEYLFRVIDTGEVIKATKIDIKNKLGVSSAAICSLFNGRQSKTHGIALA